MVPKPTFSNAALTVFLSFALLPVANVRADVASQEHHVVNGRPADVDELFGTVSIIDTLGGEPPPGEIGGAIADSMFCTGTLITPTVVLTAAHCVYDEEEGGEFCEGTMTITPGFYNGSGPFGLAVPADYIIWSEWRNRPSNLF